MKYELKLFESDIEEDDFIYDDEMEDLDAPTKSINDIKAATPYLVKIAQQVYNDWDEDDKDTYAGGGICHLIADELASYLNGIGIETATVSSSHEQHVYCVSKVIEGVYSVDIHWSYYETGGGFSWKKIPDVIFDGSELEFYRVSSDYNDWEEQVGEW